MVVGVLLVVFRTVLGIWYLARLLLCILPISLFGIFVSIVRYAVWSGRPSGRLPRLPYESSSSSTSTTSRAVSAEPASLAFSRRASQLRLPSDSQRLSLPQSLALHPNQWSEIEASRSSPLASIADSSRASALELTDEPSVAVQRPLRRSNRLRARHVRLRNSCLNSS